MKVECPPAFSSRFATALASDDPHAAGIGSGATDAANRLGHLIKAFARVPFSVLEPLSKDWVPLLLAFAASKEGVEAFRVPSCCCSSPVFG